MGLGLDHAEARVQLSVETRYIGAAANVVESRVTQVLEDSLAGIEGVATPLGELSINENRDAEHEAVVQVVEGGTFTVLE